MISPLPEPPTRQDPTNFANRADVFLAALPDFVTETNNFIAPVNDNAANITTVSNNIAAVDTVAGNLPAINTANSNATNIGIVATNITAVNAAGNNITAITAVNANSSNINTVASNVSDVASVATSIADVTDVADNLADIQTANANAANINAVAGDISNVNQVADDSLAINVVAANIALIEEALDELPNLNTKVGKTGDEGAAYIPPGTTAQRPAFPVAGHFRFNTEEESFEGFDGTDWGPIGGFADQAGNAGKMLITDGTTAGWSHSPSAVAVGTTAVDGEIRCSGPIRVIVPSDIRWKENLAPVENALGKIKQLNGYSFSWKQAYLESVGGADGYYVSEKDLGFIAQEVEEVLPEIVGTNSEGFKHVRYDRIIAVLVEAVKEQQEQIERLQNECIANNRCTIS